MKLLGSVLPFVADTPKSLLKELQLQMDKVHL